MSEEPQAVREIHEIRRKMSEEFEGLSITEIRKRIAESARIEEERIFGKNTMGGNSQYKSLSE